MAEFRAGEILTAKDLNEIVSDLQRRIAVQEVQTAGEDIFFGSIPQDFRHLVIQVYGTPASDTSRVLQLRFNTDSAANYSCGRVEHYYDNTEQQAYGNGETDANVARFGAFWWSNATITIPNYNEGNQKMARTEFGHADVNSAANSFTGQSSMIWQGGGAAIDRIRLFVLTDGFAAGSVATLYGLR